MKVNAFSLGEGKGLPLKQWGAWERERDGPPFSFPLLLKPPFQAFCFTRPGRARRKPPGLAGRGLGVGPTCSGRGISTMVPAGLAFTAWLRPHSGPGEGGKAVLSPLKCPLGPLGGGAGRPDHSHA